MLQFPRYTKFKKMFKGRLQMFEYNKKKYIFKRGSIALQARESTRLTFRQIEATRKVIRRLLGRKLKYFFKIFPFIPVTQKPNEIRMGKGKGLVKYWIDRVSCNKFLVEISSSKKYTYWQTKYALKKSAYKLPIKVRLFLNNSTFL